MINRDLDKPEFVIALRGYDRQQVDDYIARLRAVTAEAEERCREAERRHEAETAQAIKRARAAEVQERERAAEADRRARAAQAELDRKVHTTVGPRIAQMFELAVEEAKELRARAQAEAEHIRSSARDEIEEKCERGRHELDELEAQCQRRRRQLAQLKAKEQVLRTDLRHLQSALQTVARLVGNCEAETAIRSVHQPADATKVFVATGDQLIAPASGPSAEGAR